MKQMFNLQCSFKVRINCILILISKQSNLCLFKGFYNQKKKKKGLQSIILEIKF